MSSEHDTAVLDAIFNPLLPSSVDEIEAIDVIDDDEYVLSDINKANEKAGIQAAEQGKIDDAISIFKKVIESDPNGPSCYNNRAQVLRLKGDSNAALLDLNEAIKLSRGKGRSARQAFCQRGLLLWKQGNTEGARQDFEQAAKLGSQFAKIQLVKLNPYAAMCNQMLQSVFNNLYA